MTDNAKLIAAGKELDLKFTPATEGNGGYDISALLKETGNVTLDAGFTNTASCTSAITYIDGDAGILEHRGYPIEELAEHSTFLEVAYLLINGELPTKAQSTAFEHEVTHHTMMHEAFRTFLFERMIPNLKRVGLLTDKIRPKFEELGVLHFENLKHDGAIDW